MTPNPEIRQVFDSHTTTVAPNTATTTVLVASPGPGQRIRVFHASIAARPNGTGNIQVRVQGTNSSETIGMLLCDQNGGAAPLNFYPQGIPLEEDTPLQTVDRSDVASQTYETVAHYVIEAFS